MRFGRIVCELHQCNKGGVLDLDVAEESALFEDFGMVEKVLELLIVHFICLLNCCCSHPLLLYSTIRVI